MLSFARRGGLGTTFVALFLLMYLLLLLHSNRQIETPHQAIAWLPSYRQLYQPSTQDVSSLQGWVFDADRDATNYGLSHDQCNSAFPKLYPEIDRAVDYWKGRNHTITPQDTEISWRKDGAIRLLIHKNKLRVLETKVLESKHTYGNYSQRTSAVLNQITRALSGATAAGEVMPTVEFSVTVEDLNQIPDCENDTHTIWHFARRIIDRDQDRIWLIPDFNFWAAPAAEGIVEFEHARQLSKRRDKALAKKTPQVVWRGAKWTNLEVREALLNVTEGKPWADVAEINWKAKDNMITTEELCDYMFLAHTEGQSWSGRLKYLLNCNSLSIIHDLEWRTHYYHLLVPDGPEQNYISVKQDFSNLEQKVEWLLDHPDHAQRVVDNAMETFRRRYTTPAASDCYWRRLLHGWASVASTADPFEDGAQGKVLRGISIEDFL
jgi:hypothetical protein